MFIRIPVFLGELKHYYEDYENYFYLPEEDWAIHKSVGCFVEKSHRKKATAKTCYIKKEGVFLPLPPLKVFVTISFDVNIVNIETKAYKAKNRLV